MSDPRITPFGGIVLLMLLLGVGLLVFVLSPSACEKALDIQPGARPDWYDPEKSDLENIRAQQQRSAEYLEAQAEKSEGYPATPSATHSSAHTATSTSGPTAMSNWDNPSIRLLSSVDLSDETKSSLADMIERVYPAVVLIEVGDGTGSGFVIAASGVVVTNAHVVEGFNNVNVWMADGRLYKGVVTELDAQADLAMVQLNSAGPFYAIPLGDPSTVRLGEEVVALGYPLASTIGSSLTATRGIVSSTRVVAGVNILQTDAAINPGNSGGPLVNNRGQVIGISTARIEETEGGRPVEGIGFAVSATELRRLPLPDRVVVPVPTPTRTPSPTARPTPSPDEVELSTFAPERETVILLSPDEVEISISAPALYTAYSLNPVNAERKYTYKVASITGQVAAIAAEDRRYSVKLFGGARGASAISIGIYDFMMIMETIICHVDKDDEQSVDRIASLNVGSHVTIIGSIEGIVSRNIQITNCNIQ